MYKRIYEAEKNGCNTTIVMRDENTIFKVINKETVTGFSLLKHLFIILFYLLYLTSALLLWWFAHDWKFILNILNMNMSETLYSLISSSFNVNLLITVLLYNVFLFPHWWVCLHHYSNRNTLITCRKTSVSSFCHEFSDISKYALSVSQKWGLVEDILCYYYKCVNN